MLSLPTNGAPTPFVVSINMIASLTTVALTKHLSAWMQRYAEDEEQGPNPIPRPRKDESLPCG